MTALAQAARWIDRTGFALLMPHDGIEMPTLWEAIRGKPGGHPFRNWDENADRMWEWKDLIPEKGLAYYGNIWHGKPGFSSLQQLPCLLKLWGCPPGEDGFRASYREGSLSFDANRLSEALLYKGALSTHRVRLAAGLKPNSAKRALAELQKKLIIAKCGTDDTDTDWPAAVVNLSARVFPRAHAEARRMSYMEARESALQCIREAAPDLKPGQLAKLLRTGVDPA